MSELLVPIVKSSSWTAEDEHNRQCVQWIAAKCRKTFPDARVFLDKVADSHSYTWFCPKHGQETIVYIVKPHYEQKM